MNTNRNNQAFASNLGFKNKPDLLHKSSNFESLGQWKGESLDKEPDVLFYQPSSDVKNRIVRQSESDDILSFGTH